MGAIDEEEKGCGKRQFSRISPVGQKLGVYKVAIILKGFPSSLAACFSESFDGASAIGSPVIYLSRRLPTEKARPNDFRRFYEFVRPPL